MSFASKLKIHEIDYHRNGVSGVGFHAVRFKADKHEFLASVFPEPGAVSVIAIDMLADHGVKFGVNSWRGDHYEPELRAAIAAHDGESN